MGKKLMFFGHLFCAAFRRKKKEAKRIGKIFFLAQTKIEDTKTGHCVIQLMPTPKHLTNFSLKKFEIFFCLNFN